MPLFTYSMIDSATVDSRCIVGLHGRGAERSSAAEAPSERRDPAVRVRLRFEPSQRFLRQFQYLRSADAAHQAFGVVAGGCDPSVHQIDGEHKESLLREPAGDVLDLVVQAPPFMHQHDHWRGLFCRARQVSGNFAATR